MGGGILSTAIDAATNLWDWAGQQDGRVALLAGCLTWFGVERVWGLLSAPFSKILGILGLLSLLGFGGAYLADGRAVQAMGANPFEKPVGSTGTGQPRERQP